MEKKGRVMGIDYGDSRTGTALSDPSRFLSSALTCIKGGMRGVAEEIVGLVKKHEVTQIVVGLPKNMDGTEGERAATVRIFADILASITSIPIDFYDERMTTMQAYRFLDGSGTFGKKRKSAIDTLSAEIILQNYLDKERAAKR